MDLLRTDLRDDLDLSEHRILDADAYDTPWEHGSPHAAWRLMRALPAPYEGHTPDGVRIWSVTAFPDVVRVLRDTRRFGSEYGTILDVRHGDPAGGHTINLTDPPRHRALRVPTSKAMTTQALRRLGPTVRANVDRMIAPLLEPGVHDAAEHFLALAMAAMGPVIRIPEDMWPLIARAAMAGVAPSDTAYTDGDVGETLHFAHVELFGYLRETVAERRRKPGDDLISLLLTVEVEGRKLSDDDILLNCYSFLMGANTTTPHVATQLLHLLAARQDLGKRVLLGEDRPATVVEEALRWATPTNHLMRRVTEPVTLHGVDLEPGELVCAWVASANRDAAVFDDPYTFDPGRRPNPHIAFGVGAHICVGALSARTVIRLALDRIRERVTGLELAGEVRHLRSNFINGITSLPLEVRA
ncbi:cytochrome P450 [Streptomyces sp. NPDC057682]|uniref:cytochrome P450 n=1 Tax=Streptomyces sp. NPDC057682 TaxID=3346210 RepID=UPI0036BAB695